MKSVNPIYTWREWMVVPAYEEAEKGNYNKIKELQTQGYFVERCLGLQRICISFLLAI